MKALLTAALIVSCAPCFGQAPAPKPAAIPIPAPRPLPFGATHFDSQGYPRFPNTQPGIRAYRAYLYQQAQAKEAAEREAWEAYAAKMGPIIAAQQRQQFLAERAAYQLQLETSRTQSMQRIATAEEKQAEINRQRLQIQLYQIYKDQR